MCGRWIWSLSLSLSVATLRYLPNPSTRAAVIVTRPRMGWKLSWLRRQKASNPRSGDSGETTPHRYRPLTSAVCRKKIGGGSLKWGAEQADIDRPKEGVEGAEIVEGCPAPRRLGGLGSVVSSPSLGQDGAPAANGFSALWVSQNALGEKTMQYFCLIW